MMLFRAIKLLLTSSAIVRDRIHPKHHSKIFTIPKTANAQRNKPRPTSNENSTFLIPILSCNFLYRHATVGYLDLELAFLSFLLIVLLFFSSRGSSFFSIKSSTMQQMVFFWSFSRISSSESSIELCFS